MQKTNYSFTQSQLAKITALKNKKILILGAGREGYSSYQFLRSLFPKQILTISDQNQSIKKTNPWKQAFQQDMYLVGIFGQHHLNCLTQFNLIFKTPGIPSTLPPIIAAKESNCLFTSNCEWYLRLAKGKIIGITGTKGKSTTSSLIAHTFNTSGFHTLLIGNIGHPPLSYLTQTTSKTISVMELSAHQLQDLKQSPHYAVVQNITSEHLDYYQNNQAYIAAKSPIVKYQKSKDYYIYCDEFKTSNDFAKLTPAQKLTYGLKPRPHYLAYAHGRALFYHDQKYHESIIDLKRLKLIGKHNLYNLLPALILAKHFQLTNEQIQSAFYSFTPLRHRLEYVATVNHISYYNDSLSTTPVAAIAALKTFGNKNIHLLAGGFDRHQNFNTFAAQILRSSVKTLILFPVTGKRLKKAVINLALKKKILVPNFFEVETMEDAIQIVNQQAKPHDIVLLSPASASFNQFKDYADRGDKFCTCVKNLL